MASAPIDLNALDLDLQPIIQSPPLQAEVARQLVPEDLVILSTAKVGSTTPALKKIRGLHHQVARLLAAGMKSVEVSALTGMSQSRISILKNDPAFSELLSFYEKSEMSAFMDVREKMVTLGTDAASELHDRIVDDPEKIGTSTLIQIMTTALDRGGHSPVHKSESKTVNLSASDLKEIKDSASHGGTVNKKEIDYGLSRDTGSEVGNDTERKTLPPPSEEGTEREPSKGADIREESGDKAQEGIKEGEIEG